MHLLFLVAFTEVQNNSQQKLVDEDQAAGHASTNVSAI